MIHNCQTKQDSADSWAIHVRNVTKSFGSKTVVSNVDLQVKRGEIYGFLGPNGSGKTTFMRMLCGLLTPDHGEGTCLGYDIIKQQRSIKRKVGYMTQKFSFYEDLSIRENLEFVARLYKMDHRSDRVDQSIEKLGLTGRSAQLAGSLSGGWKQRMALAACMIHEPELLLLDEPTAGVDPKARRDFWDEIHQLAGQGLTVLITTHFMDEAERCHRLAYIAYGNILTRGTVQDVIDHAKLSTWIVRGPRLAELAAKLRDLPGVELVAPFGTLLHVCGPDAGQLLQSTQPFHTNEYHWEETNSGLEDVFIHLMGNAKDNFDV